VTKIFKNVCKRRYKGTCTWDTNTMRLLDVEIMVTGQGFTE